MASVQALGDVRDPAQRVRERGQAMVEFAIIAPVFILLVAGIIQFGVILNWWLDMQRIANQGARWAVVDGYPGCPRSEATPCGNDEDTLQEYLASEPVSGGLKPCVDVTFPETNGVGTGGPGAGNPVRVRLESSFTVVPIVGVGTIDLGAEATMRQEWIATHYTDADNTC
jgi:hypothetical protein